MWAISGFEDNLLWLDYILIVVEFRFMVVYTHVKFPFRHIVAEARAPVRCHGVSGLARSRPELARLLTIIFAVPFIHHVSLRTRKGNDKTDVLF